MEEEVTDDEAPNDAVNDCRNIFDCDKSFSLPNSENLLRLGFHSSDIADNSQILVMNSEATARPTRRSLTARDEVWVIPMLVISAASVSVIIIYQVLIICRAVRTSPSRRHLFLSQFLLLGLLLGSVLGFAYSLDESPATCVAVRLGTGLSYVLIYSSLLVKQVFLISLNTGVYLPAMYQALLACFAVIVQVVVVVEWLAIVPFCQFASTDHVLSLFYIIFLVILVSCLSIKSKHIKDNYREAYSIFLLMIIKIPIWLAWIICSIVLPVEYHRASFGFGLLSTCIATFLVMFLPHSRQLTAMGKEGVYLEDHEEQLAVPVEGEKFSYSQCQYSPGAPSMQKERRGGGQEEDRQDSSYQGFHRPLGVIPPSSSPYSQTPPIYHLPSPYPPYESQFPSHFYPSKLYQYWHHYYPTFPGAYTPLDSYYERGRSKSKSPKPSNRFYKLAAPYAY